MADDRPFTGAKWAQFRFGVIGSLLVSPPRPGELQGRLEELAQKRWLPPGQRDPVALGFSTIERWYYQARGEATDPIRVLQRRVRRDHGVARSLSEALRQKLLEQYTAFRGWSYQLHYDNLVALVAKHPELGPLPTYATVRRFMRRRGWRRMKRLGDPNLPGVQRAEAHLATVEVRSYEVEQPNALWHLDFHEGSRSLVTPQGKYFRPQLCGILDDHSRLCCHAQWYLDDENARDLIHALTQAFQKRGLPRSLLTDNGGAMIAGETRQGLLDCSVVHSTTLGYSPYQNGKQESFWTQVEGRLLALFARIKDITLAMLNEATQAWVEYEYNRKVHSELGVPPLTRYLAGRDASRPCPSSDELRLRFTRRGQRTQRRSDGTLTVEGVRFEVPSRFRHLDRLAVRYATWDLSRIWLWDDVRSVALAPLFPLDKAKNALSGRRALTEPDPLTPEPSTALRVPPLLESLLERSRATGLPPAYLPVEPKDDPASPAVPTPPQKESDR
jgi:putative transposase